MVAFSKLEVQCLVDVVASYQVVEFWLMPRKPWHDVCESFYRLAKSRVRTPKEIRDKVYSFKRWGAGESMVNRARLLPALEDEVARILVDLKSTEAELDDDDMPVAVADKNVIKAAGEMMLIAGSYNDE